MSNTNKVTHADLYSLRLVFREAKDEQTREKAARELAAAMWRASAVAWATACAPRFPRPSPSK
jgi:hypothetical protein